MAPEIGDGQVRPRDRHLRARRAALRDAHRHRAARRRERRRGADEAPVGRAGPARRSRAVRTVIRKAMAKDPAERYQSVQEMVEAVFGAEHVRQSVSVFSPTDLSMVAEHAARRVTGGGSAGGAAVATGSSAATRGRRRPNATSGIASAKSSRKRSIPRRSGPTILNRLAPLDPGRGRARLCHRQSPCPAWIRSRAASDVCSRCWSPLPPRS